MDGPAGGNKKALDVQAHASMSRHGSHCMAAVYAGGGERARQGARANCGIPAALDWCTSIVYVYQCRGYTPGS